MSRSATASLPKNPPQLSSKSAWARGPPQNSATTTPSRSQSPAPPTPISGTNPAHFHATHSRRSSALGQGVSIKDGVNISRSAVKQGSPVIFGSIDATQAPISSSPASARAVKPADGVKSFGSVAVRNGVSDAAKSAVTNWPPLISSASSTSTSYPAPPPASTPSSAPKFDKKSIAKLFQGPCIQSTPNPPHEVASPASRSASLPSQHSQGQPYPPNFPPSALRQGQNGNSSAPPRSPVYSRPMANGQNGGVGVSGRPQAGSGGNSAGPTPAAMPSPRMTPHAPPGPPSGMPPPQAMWPGYYYPQFVPGVPPDQFYQPQWPGHLIPQHQPPPSHHPPGAGPPSAGLAMSPRNPPIQLQKVPGTPTQSHALPPIHNPSHPSAPHPPPSVTSPPPTPSTSNRLTSSANPGAFLPGNKISIKNLFEQQVNIDALKCTPLLVAPIVPVVPPSPASSKKDAKRTIWIESEEQKERRLAEERAREGDSDERSKTGETFAKANDDAARRQIEERELRKAAERKLKEETECAAREEEERRDAEERAAREAHEAAEREKERLRLEEARAQREAAETLQRERAEQDWLRKLQEEEEAKEAAEQQRKAEEEARAAELARALAEADAKRYSLPEDDEIEDEDELNVNTENGKFQYDRDFLLQFMNICKEKPEILPILDSIGNRPGQRNSQTTFTRNSPPALPSTRANARPVEDSNRISYSDGINNPKNEFNINTQEAVASSAGTASVVSIDSLLSDRSTTTPFVPRTSRYRLTGPGANFTGMGSRESETQRQQNDDSFLQHSKYFFKDGNVTFLVDGTLFCVHRYLFSHESSYFSAQFSQLGVRDHEALSTIVSLGDVESKDFEAFLSVLYPQNFDGHGLSYEQWRSILNLSTRWGFESLRKLALRSIKPPTPYDRLLLARKYSVDDWIDPALTALCERMAPLSLDETRGMNIEDVVFVSTVREHILRFRMSVAEIPRHAEAMPAEALIPVAGDSDDVSLASSTSGATERLSSTVSSTDYFGLKLRSEELLSKLYACGP